MPVTGTLSSMPMQEILRWLNATAKTGLLTVEHERISKMVEFESGQIVSSSSNEPSNRLGQCLLSQDKITDEQLRAALAVHEQTEDRLGQVLVHQGLLTQDELTRFLQNKARETVLSLFDSSDGSFVFDETADAGPDAVSIGFEIDTLLSEGAVRRREMARYEQVFTSRGLVLQRTEKAPPNDLRESKMAWRIYESVDGERTLAELLFHAYASAFLTTKFFYQLHLMQLIEVKEVREIEQEVLFAIDRAMPLQMAAGGEDLAVSQDCGTYLGVGEEAGAASEIHVAMQFLEREEYEAALEVLSASQRRWPGNGTIRQLIFDTERRLEQSVQVDLDPESIPKLTKSAEEIQQMRLPAGAAYMPSLIDGVSDIRSILWLAPMRTVEALCSLKRLRDLGLIELTQAA